MTPANGTLLSELFIVMSATGDHAILVFWKKSTSHPGHNIYVARVNKVHKDSSPITRSTALRIVQELINDVPRHLDLVSGVTIHLNTATTLPDIAYSWAKVRSYGIAYVGCFITREGVSKREVHNLFYSWLATPSVQAVYAWPTIKRVIGEWLRND